MIRTDKCKRIKPTDEQLDCLYQIEGKAENALKRVASESKPGLACGLQVAVEDISSSVFADRDKDGELVIECHDKKFALEGSEEFFQKFDELLRCAVIVEHNDTKQPLGDWTRKHLKGMTLRITLSLRKATTEEMPKQKANPSQENKQEIPQFTAIKGKYTFDQIILPEETRRDIDDALRSIQCRELVYDIWGFGEVEPAPRSIINFYGPPGTGKTMCAHAIASRMEKPLLALKYSEIESKYLGDSTKNLKAAFDEAKRTEAVVFFDEADSFLGKRVENVQQGADQALNSLRSQMLIQLEEFSGVVIFATNLVTNYDPAFKSRILKHIKFDLPNKEARVQIFRKMLPKRLPLAEPFTEEQLLEVSEIADGFSGREIKSTILSMLLAKATPDAEEAKNITFTIDDFRSAFERKKEEIERLKKEESERLRLKIQKKLDEKAQEAKMESEANNDSPNTENPDENTEVSEKKNEQKEETTSSEE